MRLMRPSTGSVVGSEARPVIQLDITQLSAICVSSNPKLLGWSTMVISREKPTKDEIAHFNRTVANAERLTVDSQLMIDHGRVGSAIMLAIFAIEELGKALISVWGVRNKKNSRAYPSHVEKQAATFALLAAVEASTMTEARLVEIRSAGGGFHEIGPLSSQFAHARSGFFEDVRKAVTYADQDSKLPLHKLGDEITVSLASEILDWFELAGSSVTNVPAMILASTIFENDLGRM